MLRIRSIALTLFSVVSLTATSVAHAESSDWLGARAILKFANSLAKSKQLPTAVECKTTEGKEAAASFLARLTYEPNTAGIAWYVDGGSQADFVSKNKKAISKGYRLVKESMYRRPKSGLVVRCGIWYK